jgi:hypothetical protein
MALAQPLHAFFKRFARDTAGDRFLSLSEGYARVRAIEVALSLGWQVQEGTPASGMADYLRTVDDRLQVERRWRELTFSGGSTDLTIVTPVQAMIELKVCPDIGTKSGHRV